ncbi:hypothetical protein GCM10020229_56440 [Kitasatospora albolonga]
MYGPSTVAVLGLTAAGVEPQPMAWAAVPVATVMNAEAASVVARPSARSFMEVPSRFRCSGEQCLRDQRLPVGHGRVIERAGYFGHHRVNPAGYHARLDSTIWSTPESGHRVRSGPAPPG